MDTNLVFVKTPIGDEAIRQSTRVVKRNLRMILVQVDGKLSVAELSAKIGNRQLVEVALRELEAGGFIAPTLEGVSVWEEGVRKANSKPVSPPSDLPAVGSAGSSPQSSGYSVAMASSFSTFGKSPTTKRSAVPQVEIPFSEPFVAEKKQFDAPGKATPSTRNPLLAIVVIVLIGLLAVFFFPYGSLRPAVEAATSNYLQVPVQVGSVDLKFWPKPALVLSDIKLGERGDSSIESLSVPPLYLIGFGVLDVQQINISGASFSVDRLLDLPMFSGKTEGKGAIHVQRLELERLTVSAGDLALELGGRVLIGASGEAEKIEFQNVDRSIRVSAVRANPGLLLSIDGYGWKPFANLSLTFDSLQAKGLLQQGKLVIQNFDTALLGGVVKGSWMLDWSAGLAMAGDASLARLNSGLVSAAFAPKLRIEGQVAGDLRLRGSGLDSVAMWRNVDAELDLVMLNGVIHGLDLGEAIRRGAGSEVRGGSTKFDRLTGTLGIKPGQVDARSIQLDAGVMVANGQAFASAESGVAASLLVAMQRSSSSQRLPVKLSGNLPDLLAVAGR